MRANVGVYLSGRTGLTAMGPFSRVVVREWRHIEKEKKSFHRKLIAVLLRVDLFGSVGGGGGGGCAPSLARMLAKTLPVCLCARLGVGEHAGRQTGKQAMFFSIDSIYNCGFPQNKKTADA